MISSRSPDLRIRHALETPPGVNNNKLRFELRWCMRPLLTINPLDRCRIAEFRAPNSVGSPVRIISSLPVVNLSPDHKAGAPFEYQLWHSLQQLYDVLPCFRSPAARRCNQWLPFTSSFPRLLLTPSTCTFAPGRSSKIQHNPHFSISGRA